MTNNNCQLRDDLKAITVNIFFEASALNRDEKLGGNIPSIKKLTRFGNRTFGYISRVAMRHYLFETLSKSPFTKDGWMPATCIESGAGDNKVVQFDLRSQNILTHAELDAFGYMFTIGGQSSITRKAAVGITKAVALETWEGDMQFNANHDLAQRCRSNPNPVNKEEQKSFFKVSFTIDIDKLGYDEWWIEGDDYDGATKKLTLNLSKEVRQSLDDVEEKDGAEEKDRKVYIKKRENNTVGEIIIETKDSKKKVIFRLDDKKKKERLCQILEVLKNGLIYHASGENYGIVPQFIIAAGLKLPIPLFNSFVEIGSFEDSILDNAYILCKDGRRLVYVYNPKNLVGQIKISELYTDWNEFLKKLGVKENGTSSQNQNTSA